MLHVIAFFDHNSSVIYSVFLNAQRISFLQVKTNVVCTNDDVSWGGHKIKSRRYVAFYLWILIGEVIFLYFGQLLLCLKWISKHLIKSMEMFQWFFKTVTFIHWATTFPLGTIGSLRPTFVSVRRVDLAVKLPSTFALEGQCSSGPKKPLHASVTFWETYIP